MSSNSDTLNVSFSEIGFHVKVPVMRPLVKSDSGRMYSPLNLIKIGHFSRDVFYLQDLFRGIYLA